MVPDGASSPSSSGLLATVFPNQQHGELFALAPLCLNGADEFADRRAGHAKCHRVRWRPARFRATLKQVGLSE